MRISAKILIIVVISNIFLVTVSVSNDMPKVVHVFVALCDNDSQGIVPVSAKLGNGDDPRNNLYWGALYGVKTFFKKSPNWSLINSPQVHPPILERCIFRHKKQNAYLVADAYRGREIKQAITGFLNAISGASNDIVFLSDGNQKITVNIGGNANLIAYVGHNGLMDFQLKQLPVKRDNRIRESIILACLSKLYFLDAVNSAGAKPLLWTTGLIAPEAYTLENAIEGWLIEESDEKIHLRAAEAYNKYQKCGLKAAKRLLVSGL
jgi:hypothetical protein